MNERLLWLVVRAHEALLDLQRGREEEPEMLYEPGTPFAGQEGLSQLAITVILVAVGVGLTLAVVAILGPAIRNLAQNTGNQIESVPFSP